MYKDHSTFHEGDSGVDLFCPEKIVVKPGETCKVNLQIKCEAFNDSDTSCSYQLFARSSLSKTPLRLAYSVGIIDRDYRGFIFAVFDNIKGFEYTVEPGMRLVQMCAPDLGPIKMELADELSESGTRGEGGFGSTGR